MEHNSFDDQIFGDFGDSLTPLGPKPIQAHHINSHHHHHQSQQLSHHQQPGNHSIHVMLGGGQDMCQTQTRLPECNTILPGSPSLREVYGPLDYGNCQKVTDYISINKLGCYSPTQKYDYKLEDYSPQQKLHSLDYHQNGEQQHPHHQQHHSHMQIYGHSPLHNNSSTTSTGGCDSERGTPQGPIDSNGINGTVGVVSLQNGSNNSNKKKEDNIGATTTLPSTAASGAGATPSSIPSSSCSSSSSNVNSSVVVDQSSMNSNGTKKNDKNKKVDANGVKKKKTR